MKKWIWVTGAGGFLGGWIAWDLICSGHDVAAFHRRPLHEGSPLHHFKTERFVLIRGDLHHRDFRKKVLKRYPPAVIVHAAWQGVRGEKREDAATQLRNVLLMRKLLDAARSARVVRFIGLGSQAEYGAQAMCFREDTVCCPETVYGVAKWTAGQLGRLFGRRYGFDYAWLRVFSVYGPGDHEDGLVPMLIQSLLHKKPLDMSAADRRWDLLYVKDVALMVRRVVDSQNRFCACYNLCHGRPVPLKKIVETAFRVVGSRCAPRFGKRPVSSAGPYHLQGDPGLFHKAFGKVSLTSLRQGLEETYLWEKRYRPKIKPN